MKNTLITLISVAALTGAANAQVTIGGTTYNIGDGLVFNTVADAIAGNVDHVNARIPGSRYDRTYGVGQPNYYYDSLLHSVRSAGTTTNLTWGTAGVTQIDDSWIQSDGVVEMIVGQQVPEPSSSALLGLGALGLLTRRKRS